MRITSKKWIKLVRISPSQVDQARENFIPQLDQASWEMTRKIGKTNLNLRGAGGETCAVWFVEDATADLPAAQQVAPNYYAFYYHHSQLTHLIDMLRNEKPIFVFFNNDSGFNNSRISTTDEPVGEGEET